MALRCRQSFFSFGTYRGGYAGTATFCRSSVAPVAAESGLTGAATQGKETQGARVDSFWNKSVPDNSWKTFWSKASKFYCAQICKQQNGSLADLTLQFSLSNEQLAVSEKCCGCSALLSLPRSLGAPGTPRRCATPRAGMTLRSWPSWTARAAASSPTTLPSWSSTCTVNPHLRLFCNLPSLVLSGTSQRYSTTNAPFSMRFGEH